MTENQLKAVKQQAAQFPQLFNLKPDVSAVKLKAEIQQEEQKAEREDQKKEVARKRMLVLMQEGNPELVLRIIKTLYHDATLDTAEHYSKHPEAFLIDVQKLVKDQSRDVIKFQHAYSQYRREFEKHFKTTMNEWETWQLDLFRTQVEVVSVFLAYKTVEGVVKEEDVINELIQNLDPVNPDITATAYMKGKRTEDIMTTGFIGILAVLGAVFAMKRARKA